MIFEVTTRAGKSYSIDTNRTDSQAQDILAKKVGPSSFERDLAERPEQALSAKQRAWLHVLAEWTVAKDSADISSESFPGILSMLQGARDAGKKFPKIKLHTDLGLVVLALNRAGKVNVTDGKAFGENVWFGAIQDNGTWRAGRGNANAVREILHSLEADPAGVASQHGVATGNCCFCAKDLTTKESRSVGYGPICAGKFGLPWGKVDPGWEAAGALTGISMLRTDGSSVEL